MLNGPGSARAWLVTAPRRPRSLQVSFPQQTCPSRPKAEKTHSARKFAPTRPDLPASFLGFARTCTCTCQFANHVLGNLSAEVFKSCVSPCCHPGFCLRQLAPITSALHYLCGAIIVFAVCSGPCLFAEGLDEKPDCCRFHHIVQWLYLLLVDLLLVGQRCAIRFSLFPGCRIRRESGNESLGP